MWAVASVAFAFYVAHFGSYDKTYGTPRRRRHLPVWLWLSNVALLLGMEFSAERERSRELATGHPEAEHELHVERRTRPKGEASPARAGKSLRQ